MTILQYSYFLRCLLYERIRWPVNAILLVRRGKIFLTYMKSVHLFIDTQNPGSARQLSLEEALTWK